MTETVHNARRAYPTVLWRGAWMCLRDAPVGGSLPSKDAQSSALFSAKVAGLLAQLRQIVPDTE